MIPHGTVGRIGQSDKPRLCAVGKEIGQRTRKTLASHATACMRVRFALRSMIRQLRDVVQDQQVYQPQGANA